MPSGTKDYFYAENYFDYAVQLRSFNNYTSIPETHVGHWSSLTRIVLVILTRIGFVLVQIGSVPVNNVNLILLQNVVDLCCVTVIYFLTGFLIAYNGDLAGLTGQGRWIGDPTIDKDEAIVGWQAVAITSAICTTAVVGRIHTLGYLLTGVALAGLIQPLLIHWAWTANGWMTESNLADRRVVFKDYAGAAVVHVVGGLSGLIGCVVLGRRMLKLRDLDDASITAGSAGTVFGGLLLIFVGLQGLCTRTYSHDRFRVLERDPSHAYVNNLLAASSCSLLIVALHFALSREAFNHWTVMRCVQGTIAGVVAVSAAANDYSPQAAIGLGCLAGVVFYLISRRVFHSALEDYCNVTAIHLSCAILGSLAAPICAARADEDVATILLNFSWHLICLVTLLTLVGTTMLLLFGLLQCCGVLRNRSECLNHVRANAAMDRGPPRSFLQRLFFPDSGCLYLQPGSTAGTERQPSVGSRFWKYQTEIDKLEGGRPVVADKPVANVEAEDNFAQVQAPGARVKKARQVHTLSVSAPVFVKEEGGIGESINQDLPEIGKKLFLGREIKYSLDPIEEIDEEGSKEFEMTENTYNGEKKNSILTENFNTPAESKDPENYQLRRTVKLTNLHHEFSREDLKVVLGPRRLDSSSSDSCDEDGAVMRTMDSSESRQSIATSNNSSFYSEH
ncbi:putative ammonium transporter sll1017 [Odontomachus brunneus]|uniref:putative ammonium transporter sll1017 n=1 Tax=Odontomachus brunneus TaxID=486640 RepID=UPI0013F281F4|nr:putative ammonium transporter sll1017 [Odontomachus brunneus]